MKITPLGAAGEVTGSAYLVESARGTILIDFGLFQGGRMTEKRNRVPNQLNVEKLDAILITHAHLDHTGRLPLLARQAYSGPVFASPATIDFTRLILRDAAKIQEYDNQRINRKRLRAGDPPVEPLFTPEDVGRILKLFQPVPYRESVPIRPGIHARFVEAGHMLGSTSIQIIIHDQGAEKRVVFSGDLGPHDAPILKDAEPFARADTVFLESTYGDRDHRPLDETVTEFRQIIAESVARKGKILVPTFAVGRAQLLLYYLALMFRDGSVPHFPVYVDSPMAVEASQIYLQHPELYDDDLNALRKEKSLLKDLVSVKPTLTADESRALNEISGPCLIMAGAGMCNAGRILHHLKQNLWRRETAVLIVGYQAHGSLGRLLLDGRPHVKIFGEKIAVRARIHSLGGFSAHAGQTDLMNWLASLLDSSRPQIILTHGESHSRIPLARLIQERHQIRPLTPAFGESIPVVSP